VAECRCGVVLACGASLLGCGAAPDLADGVHRRDSAGITVVESASPQWSEEPGWRLSNEPVLSLGTADGLPTQQFAAIVDLARFSDGTIVVADGRSAELRYFDGRGTHVATAGGQGEGPGEFRVIESLATAPGDTLWVYDFSLRRFTVLGHRGALHRVVLLEAPPPALGFAGRFADGTLLMAQYWGASQTDAVLEEGLLRDLAAFVPFAPDGSQLDTVGLFPGREVHLATEEGRMVMGSPLFGRTLSRVAGNHGFWLGDQEVFEVGSYDPRGTLRMLVRITGADLSISAQDVEAVLEERLRDTRSHRRRAMRAFLEEAARPPTRPAYGDFLLDALGNLWISEYRAAGGPADDWHVITPDGRWLGTVSVPERFRPYAIGDTWVLGVDRDELDVEYVRLYTLTK
jgi:hypothetical protein